MQTTNDALFNAYQILASAARDLRAGGRRPLGATLKPKLYWRGIAEFQLGFLKFGDFLRAAEAAGFVSLSRSEGGDIEVWPTEAAQQPGAETAVPVTPAVVGRAPYTPRSGWPESSYRSVPIRVRQDLWNAFNSFSDKWVYDVAQDKAYKVPSGQTDLFTPPGARLIAIPPARERMTDWMKSFAGTQDSDTKASLRAALEGEAAQYSFKNIVMTNPRLNKSWRNYHIQQVVAAIDAWATANGIRPKDVTTTLNRAMQMRWAPRLAAPPVSTPLPQNLASVAPVGQPGAPVTLAPRLAGLIDELIDELLRLRGALQVVDSKH